MPLSATKLSRLRMWCSASIVTIPKSGNFMPTPKSLCISRHEDTNKPSSSSALPSSFFRCRSLERRIFYVKDDVSKVASHIHVSAFGRQSRGSLLTYGLLISASLPSSPGWRMLDGSSGCSELDVAPFRFLRLDTIGGPRYEQQCTWLLNPMPPTCVFECDISH